MINTSSSSGMTGDFHICIQFSAVDTLLMFGSLLQSVFLPWFSGTVSALHSTVSCSTIGVRSSVRCALPSGVAVSGNGVQNRDHGALRMWSTRGACLVYAGRQ